MIQLYISVYTVFEIVFSYRLLQNIEYNSLCYRVYLFGYLFCIQCSCLENPRDRGAWWAAVHGVAQSQTWLKWLSSRSDLAAAVFYFLVPETIKLLEENIGKTLSNIHHSRILYDPPPRTLEIKAKINKWDLINLKSFCTSKETISKVKRQPSEWEKIIANEATWTGNSFLTWYFTCFNAILPNLPTLSLSHRVHKTLLYISVSFPVSYTGLLLPSF